MGKLKKSYSERVVSWFFILTNGNYKEEHQCLIEGLKTGRVDQCSLARGL